MYHAARYISLWLFLSSVYGSLCCLCVCGCLEGVNGEFEWFYSIVMRVFWGIVIETHSCGFGGVLGDGARKCARAHIFVVFGISLSSMVKYVCRVCVIMFV